MQALCTFLGRLNLYPRCPRLPAQLIETDKKARGLMRVDGQQFWGPSAAGAAAAATRASGKAVVAAGGSSAVSYSFFGCVRALCVCVCVF